MATNLNGWKHQQSAPKMESPCQYINLQFPHPCPHFRKRMEASHSDVQWEVKVQKFQKWWNGQMSNQDRGCMRKKLSLKFMSKIVSLRLADQGFVAVLPSYRCLVMFNGWWLVMAEDEHVEFHRQKNETHVVLTRKKLKKTCGLPPKRSKRYVLEWNIGQNPQKRRRRKNRYSVLGRGLEVTRFHQLI